MKLSEELKNIDISTKKLREFGLFVGGILAVIGGLLLWRSRPAYIWFLSIATALMILGATAPVILKPLYRIWMGFALIMGFIMSHVLLGILFFLIVTPISFIAKLMKNELLDTAFPDKKNTYWRARKQPASMESYEKQY